MSDVQSRQDTLDRLEAEILARSRAGEPFSAEDYVRRHPELANEILTRLGRFESSSRSSQPSPPSGDISEGGEHDLNPDDWQLMRVDRLGDFRILREIGRGGMGVVYEAEQESLKRRVALKVLTADVTHSPRRLKRFQREANLAAQLHHTNIVPVYGVGTDQGRHFYAMQFIDGVPLSFVIDLLRERGFGVRLDDIDDDLQPAERPLALVTDALRGLLKGSSRSHLARARGASWTWETRSASSSSTAESPGAGRAEASAPGDSQGSLEMALVQPESSYHPDDSENGLIPMSPPRSNHAPAVVEDTSYWYSVARLAADVCEAVDYAHQHRVLHRDIKPANLLLDRQGEVWVTDFGLARQEDQEAITHSGDLVGTLRYMAPEQFLGQVTVQTDVYGLGITLYELLTLRPAFEEIRHGPLIDQKRAGPPLAPRLVNASIPRDLETITLKACAADPRHRYASAAELAADLYRFLDDRPILARHVTSAERLGRWARRNPTLAFLTSSTLVLLVTLVIVFAIGHYRTSRALAVAEQARQHAVTAASDARREFTRAETNLQLAIEAFEQIVDDVSSRGVPESLGLDVELGDSPLQAAAVTPADAQLLEKLLHFFDEFARQNRVDLQGASAAARQRVGDIQQRLDRLDEAEEAYREALRAYETLASQESFNVAHLVARAQIQNELGSVLGRRGLVRSAIDAHQNVVELLEESPGVLETDEGRFELARTLIMRNSIGIRSGLANLLEALQPPSGKPPASPSDPPPPSRENNSSGRSRSTSSLAAQFLESNQRALDLLEPLVARAPKNASYRLMMARGYRNRSRFASMARDEELTHVSVVEAIDHLDQLVADFPQVPMFQSELADMLCLASTLLHDPSFAPPADDPIFRAKSLCEDLLSAHPHAPEYEALTASVLRRLAVVQAQQGETSAAWDSFVRAIQYQQRLALQYPAVLLYQIAYAQSLSGLAELETQQGNITQAITCLEIAIDHLVQHGVSDEENPLLDRFIEQMQRRCDELTEEV